MSSGLRVLIVGNSGSGKTWLSRQIATRRRLPICHMDALLEPDDASLRKAKSEIYTDIARLADESSWIVEGAFGDCAMIVLPRATHFIWLDLEWAECRSNIIDRGLRNDFWGAGQSPAALEELLVWAEGYQQRESLSSRQGHRSLFEMFGGPKFLLRSRSEIDNFLSQL